LGEGLLIFASVFGILLLFTGWEVFVLSPSENIIRALAVTLIFQLSLYFTICTIYGSPAPQQIRSSG
jgi:hypothetical protein